MTKKSFLKCMFPAICCCLFAVSSIYAQGPKVTLSGIRNDKGKILVSVFKDSEQYEDEKPYKTFQFDKKNINNGSMAVLCPLEPGTYGIVIVDDENNNGKIDKNFIGIPKEGFGFSNFYMTKMKKPAFDDFKVDVKPAAAKIEIKVKYM